MAARERRLFLSPQVRQAHPHIAVSAFPAAHPEATGSGAPDLLGRTARATEPRARTLETAHGPILPREWCPLSLVGRLHPNEELNVFVCRAKREQALLKCIAAAPESELVVAHTDTKTSAPAA